MCFHTYNFGVIIILSFLNTVWPYAVAILVFILLIVIHELGHFFAAKSCKVKVNEFAVGFGPKIFGKRWGETYYRFNIIPLGGYCAMEGEDEQSSEPRAFCNAKAWKRFIIVVSGALCNILLGLILSAIILCSQSLLSTTTVAKFDENAKSAQSGLQVGDKIIAVDSRRVFTVNDLSYTFTNVEGDKVDLTVKRDGKKVVLNDVTFNTAEENGINYLQVDFFVLGQEKTFGNVIVEAFKTTLSYARIVWMSLIDLITGKYGLSAVSGPVGLTQVLSESAQNGLLNLLPIMTLITINLGVFNLLPLPALDGGRLLFILFEMIFGKKVPEKFEGWVHAAGFALLIGLMLLVTAKDIWMWIAR